MVNFADWCLGVAAGMVLALMILAAFGYFDASRKDKS